MTIKTDGIRIRREQNKPVTMEYIRTQVHVEGECWVWKKKTKNPYGSIDIDGKHLLVHRVVWKLVNGPVPEGLDVLHTCDNPPCCNPKHLFVGTAKDNVRDMISKGRQNWSNLKPSGAHGEQIGASKLTEIQVREIRQDTISQVKELAKLYGVTRQTITNIRFRRWWKWLH